MTTTDITIVNGNYVSDLYKDAYGFRPGAAFWTRWAGLTHDERVVECDRMVQTVEEECNRARNEETLAYAAWSKHIATIMETNGVDRATAIRWDMDSMDCDGDAGYYCYKWGMSYSVEGEIKPHL
jgi:hypothetical protein